MKFLKTKKYSVLSYLLKYSFVIVFTFIVLAPMVFAVCSVGEPGCSVGDQPGGSNGDTKINVTIDNPLASKIDTIPKFIEEVINIVLIVGVPIVVLAIIYTGFLFVKAQGKPEEITTAKKALMYTLIGAALLLGAFVIANAIQATVDDIKKTT